MLSKINYSKSHIEELHSEFPKVTPLTFERTLHAFGLLQCLIDSGLNFIFKGGTSLMLLLKEPKRVSTDIDILVQPGSDVQGAVSAIEHHYPLLALMSNASNVKNGIQVAHYSFSCPSFYQLSSKVLLDVYYGETTRLKTIQRPLANRFLINDGLPSLVSVPSPESLLGDKLTAFAPHTVGVQPFMTSFGKPCDKRLQIIKQLYDINELACCISNFAEVRQAYFAALKEEEVLHGVNMSEKDVISDSFFAALSIATRGASDLKNEYQTIYRPGIEKLKDYIFAFDWNTVQSQNCGVNALLLFACLLSGRDYGSLTFVHRPAFHDFPYSAIAKSIQSRVLFDRATTAVSLFDPKAK